MGLVFDDDERHHRCCCGVFHVKTGAIIIGIIETVFLVLGLLSLLYTLIAVGFTSHALISLGVDLFYALILFLLFYGIAKEKALFILPHLILQIVHIVIFIIVIIMAIIVIATGGVFLSTIIGTTNQEQVTNINATDVDQQYDSTLRKLTSHTGLEVNQSGITASLAIFGIVGILMSALCLLVAIWFFIVIKNAYCYCKEKDGAKEVIAGIF